MSMAHSLEVRVPILDHRMIEFAGALPERYKLRGSVTKWAFRELLKGKLPEPILSAGKKGFSPPIPAWLAGPLKPLLEEVLSEDSIKKTGILDPAYVRNLMHEHWGRKRDHHRRLWAVMNFILWYRRWA
jgi:asparagine synthase (glutamine-hydrolysing)